jgi:hypothetical protein
LLSLQIVGLAACLRRCLRVCCNRAILRTSAMLWGGLACEQCKTPHTHLVGGAPRCSSSRRRSRLHTHNSAAAVLTDSTACSPRPAAATHHLTHTPHLLRAVLCIRQRGPGRCACLCVRRASPPARLAAAAAPTKFDAVTRRVVDSTTNDDENKHAQTARASERE